MNFCIVVDHGLTHDFCHDSKQNGSQKQLFLGKMVKILCKNCEKWGNICRIHIFDILVYNFAQWYLYPK